MFVSVVNFLPNLNQFFSAFRNHSTFIGARAPHVPPRTSSCSLRVSHSARTYVRRKGPQQKHTHTHTVSRAQLFPIYLNKSWPIGAPKAALLTVFCIVVDSSITNAQSVFVYQFRCFFFFGLIQGHRSFRCQLYLSTIHGIIINNRNEFGKYERIGHNFHYGNSIYVSK